MTLAVPPGPLLGRELTSRECEVVTLVSDGLSNNEIADLLFVSPRTVQSHVASALGKLGARTRTQLAVTAIRRGVIPLHPGETEGSSPSSVRPPVAPSPG